MIISVCIGDFAFIREVITFATPPFPLRTPTIWDYDFFLRRDYSLQIRIFYRPFPLTLVPLIMTIYINPGERHG